jgi:hypothetical protein
MGPHHLPRRFVQDEIDKVKVDHAVEARGKVTKELVQIPVRSDSFRNLEKCLVLAG